MKYKAIFNKRKYASSRKKIYNYTDQIDNINYVNIDYNYQKLIFIFALFFCYFIIFKHKRIKAIKANANLEESKKTIFFDQFEVNKYNEIKEKLLRMECSQMRYNQREFLNGIIRKLRPKKILEIGVYRGGSSIIILNAINDFEDAHLYSIDLNSEDSVGECAYKYFSNLLKKWTLFKGNIATEFMEQIGKEIDMVFFDTAHLEPGEILDFLIVLPFLKENAIAIFHDIAFQLMPWTKRKEFAPYIIYNAIRGKKYLPSGKNILTHSIGAVKLDKNQNLYYHDYFRLLGGQWQYYPKETHMSQIKKYFKKFYDEECLIMFEEASSFNKNFVKKYPMEVFYRYTSD